MRDIFQALAFNLRELFRRPKPATPFHRCLAVHIHFAGGGE